jgi:hypothetical protein
MGTMEHHVCEVGDENGEYAIKDEAWEAPYFDPAALADDLEKIGREMKPMLEPVSRLIDDPELFVTAADEIDEKIGSFPEWMQGGEWCELGSHATTCVLAGVDMARDGTEGDDGAAVSGTNFQTG